MLQSGPLPYVFTISIDDEEEGVALAVLLVYRRGPHGYCVGSDLREEVVVVPHREGLPLVAAAWRLGILPHLILQLLEGGGESPLPLVIAATVFAYLVE